MAKWFLISFALFVCVLLFSSVKLVFRGSLGSKEIKMICEIRAFYGLVRTDLRLRKIESHLNQAASLLKVWQELKCGELSITSELLARSDMLPESAKIRATVGLLRQRKHNRWLYTGLKQGIMIEEIRWQTAVGTEDAMVTALAAGALWSAKSVIMGYLSRQVSVMKSAIWVNPDYTQPVFHTRIMCAVRLKVIYLVLGTIIIGSAVRGIRIPKD